ncbi:hypothetical protein M231_00823 [Tremella mesenterica]|uniref:Uncharacterized protein n=1 Tax=Tremella mesenterica TaxID=5217 RepID=A0A4Q1BUL8_TREME|nr:hypothetical protein M231_00823 [Tremella mesenterica]
MSALVRGTAGARRSLLWTIASSSRFTPFRRYATETDVPPVRSDAPDVLFDTSSTGRNAQQGGAILKRYTGKGFPAIPSLRHLVHPYHPHLYSGQPLRELTLPQRKKGGRNHTGRIVNRHVGGGHRRRLRTVDFYRLEGGEHDVIRIEYDPGRSSHIALIRRRNISSITSPKISPEEGAILAELPKKKTSSLEEKPQRDEVKAGWSYILAPEGLRAGDIVTSYRSGIPAGFVEGWTGIAGQSGDTSDSRALGLLRTGTLKIGNVLPLYLIPPGTVIHNIALSANGKMLLCRSAGSNAQVVAHHGPKGEALGGSDILKMGGGLDKDGKRIKSNGSVLIKLQSGEVRRVEPGCVATIGTVSNKEHHSRQLGKAGRSRWLGIRPRVRGVAMNAADHPHGGGRGKSKGNKHPRSIYGWLTRGKRTRRPKDKNGNKMVVSQRPRLLKRQ